MELLQKCVRIFLLSLLVLLLAPQEGRAADEKRQPNVLIIYADDLGSLDANCYGSNDLLTPNIDRLAASGLRFTQMYAPSAICSSSRAGLMTGRFPARAGVPSNVSSQPGTVGMPRSEVTIAEVLEAGGYRTGHVGKWHLGFTPKTMPNGQGFEQSFGHMGGCIDNYSHFFYWNGPNRHDLWRNGKEVYHNGKYFGDLMVDECKRLVSEWRDQPFFIYWAINWPHYPLQPTETWQERYAELPQPRRDYAAFVSTLDERIGEVLERLQQLGLRDDTIVVFQSDHGHSIEERTFGGGGNPGPYRGCKGCLFEGGIRVPAIVSWPRQLAAGKVRDQLATGCDWLPTIAALTKTQLPDCQLDGKSLVSVMESAAAPSPHESFYWQLGTGKRAQWVVRRGDWKLLGNPRDLRNPNALDLQKHLFLANVRTDVGETENLVDKNPQIAEELLELRRRFDSNIQP